MPQIDASNPSMAPVSEESSIKSLILALRKTFKEFLRYWWILLLFILVCTGLFALKSYYIDPITYNAKLTFMLSEDGGSGGSSLSSVLGMFGGGVATSYSLDKMIELTKSRKIIGEALFTQKEIGGKKDFFANHLIRSEKFDKEFKEMGPDMAGFIFTHGFIDSFSRKENRALLYLYVRIIGNAEEGIEGLLGTKYGETSGILTYTLKTQNETLSIELLRELYARLSTFYISKSTQRETQTYRLILAKKDSIERVLKQKDYAAANFKDKSNGLVFSASAVPGQQLDRDKKMLEVMYGESIKNAEMADYALKNETPFIQQIDLPIAPIKSSLPTIVKVLIIGVALGMILGCLFLYVRMVIRAAMAQ